MNQKEGKMFKKKKWTLEDTIKFLKKPKGRIKNIRGYKLKGWEYDLFAFKVDLWAYWIELLNTWEHKHISTKRKEIKYIKRMYRH